MSKAKSEAAKKEELKELKLGKRGDVKEVVEKIGKSAFEIEAENADEKAKKVLAMFRDAAKTQGWSFSEISDNSLIQYVNNARSELGWTRSRKSSSATKAVAAGDEPTVSDLKAARKLAEELGMDTGKLREFVGKLTAFGSLEKLEASLEALDELVGD